MARMRGLNIVVVALAGVYGVFGVALVWAEEPTVRSIGSERQLFLDDWIIAQTTNVVRQPSEVVKHPGNPIIKRDKPWDQGRCDIYGNAVYDAVGKRLQVFYSAVSSSTQHDDRLAYAVSSDGGTTWTKPDLGLISLGGNSNNNLVLNAVSGSGSGYIAGACVFLDMHETDPAKRYKLFDSEAYAGMSYGDIRGFLFATGASVGKVGMYVAYSPDGIHWTRPSTEPVLGMHSDATPSVFWDARLGKYVTYVRARMKEVRSVGRLESANFETWTEPQVVLVGTSARQIYSMGVTPYQGMYVGTPWIFDTTATGDEPTKPVMWPELAVSRDGIAWSLPFEGNPLISTGPAGSADFAQIRMSSSLVLLDDTIILIYGQTDRGHVADMRVDVGMATMRLDGFAAMAAGATAGAILTKPLKFSGNRLEINAKTADGGSIVLKVLDAAGKPIEGFPKSDPFRGDALRHVVTFNGNEDVSMLAGKPIVLRFQLADAELFSFAFQ